MRRDMTPFVWLIFVGAAMLEVSGDAMIWKGLRGWGWAAVAAGGLILAGYGLVVNLVKWEFAKLLGVYVAVFAVVSVTVGRLVFQEPAAIHVAGPGPDGRRRTGDSIRSAVEVRCHGWSQSPIHRALGCRDPKARGRRKPLEALPTAYDHQSDPVPGRDRQRGDHRALAA